MSSTFSENLEKLISTRGISIRELAKRINVSPSTLQEWVGSKGSFPRSPEHLKNLSKELGVSVHQLLFGEPDPKEDLSSLLDKTEIHTGIYEISIKKIKFDK